jgi:hypothetical protein
MMSAKTPGDERLQKLNTLHKKGRMIITVGAIMDTVRPLLDPNCRSKKRERRYVRLIRRHGGEGMWKLIEDSGPSEWEKYPLFYGLLAQTFMRDHKDLLRMS